MTPRLNKRLNWFVVVKSFINAIVMVNKVTLYSRSGLSCACLLLICYNSTNYRRMWFKNKSYFRSGLHALLGNSSSQSGGKLSNESLDNTWLDLSAVSHEGALSWHNIDILNKTKTTTRKPSRKHKKISFTVLQKFPHLSIRDRQPISRNARINPISSQEDE